jgi:hypothetical protein
MIEFILGAAALINAVALLVQSAKQAKTNGALREQIARAALSASAANEAAGNAHGRITHLDKRSANFAVKRSSKKKQAAMLAAMSRLP